LQIQPKPCAGIEVPGKAQSSVGRDPAALVNDFRNPCHGDAEIERQPIHAELKWFHELRAQNLAGVNGREAFLKLSYGDHPRLILPVLSERRCACHNLGCLA